MATIRAPGFEQAVTSPPPITGWSEKKTIAQSQSKNAESCACPQCGMRYRFQDGILYPQSHNKNGVCDACHLEEVIGNITAHEPLHRIINIAITKPSLKKQILIPERKQRFIESVAETLGGFALSRQEIGTVLDLCNDVDISIELAYFIVDKIPVNLGITVMSIIAIVIEFVFLCLMILCINNHFRFIYQFPSKKLQ